MPLLQFLYVRGPLIWEGAFLRGLESAGCQRRPEAKGAARRRWKGSVRGEGEEGGNTTRRERAVQRQEARVVIANSAKAVRGAPGGARGGAGRIPGAAGPAAPPAAPNTCRRALLPRRREPRVSQNAHAHMQKHPMGPDCGPRGLSRCSWVAVSVAGPGGGAALLGNERGAPGKGRGKRGAGWVRLAVRPGAKGMRGERGGWCGRGRT
ncbi:MAG: hypothetical protein J3K34DRAFT_430945 [Monoraphidium minutum]|nr:MAG: hypothetical protein J3K34DRAFT_430945 [Monoraphidium minutum]